MPVEHSPERSDVVGSEHQSRIGPGEGQHLCLRQLAVEASPCDLDGDRVAEGVDVKTAQTMLGHSEARLTLDVYAQAVAKLGEAAAEAMGARFLGPAARDERAMASGSEGESG